MPKTAALRAAVFQLYAKNLKGVFKHTPGPARVKKVRMYMNGQIDRVRTHACYASTCCTGPGPYHPIGQFWVIGIIVNSKFVFIKPQSDPSHCTSSPDRGMLPQTGPSPQEVQLSSEEHMTSWGKDGYVGEEGKR